MTHKGQECIFSFLSYAQDVAKDSWIDTKKYLNDSIKAENMDNPINLASIFLKNDRIYVAIVIKLEVLMEVKYASKF